MTTINLYIKSQTLIRLQSVYRYHYVFEIVTLNTFNHARDGECLADTEESIQFERPFIPLPDRLLRFFDKLYG